MMQKKISLASLALLMLSPAVFACEYPKKVDVPDGTTASKEEMLEGQNSVKAYMTEMEDYLACLEQQEKDTLADMPDITEEELANRDAALTKKYNAAVQEMELLAARFNEEVRAYKDKGE